MAFITDKIIPFGGLDKDSEPTMVKNGDYTDALNIQIMSSNVDKDGPVQIVQGNELSSTITGVTTSQKKKYKITWTNDGVSVHELLFKLTDGTTVVTITFTEGATNAATITNIGTGISGRVYNLTPHPGAFDSFLFTGGTEYGYFEQATSYGYEWDLVCDTLPVFIATEAYDQSVVGDMNVIGSYDLLGDLLIFSTTGNEEVVENTVTVLSTSADANNQILLGITGDTSSMSNGDLIVIYGATNGLGINGSWIVFIVDSITIKLLNSLYVGPFSGEITIQENTSSVSEIGVQTRDNNTNIFTYTRLLRSKELGFKTIHQIDSVAEKNNTKTSVYFTDFNSVPRVFYYKGDYITDGALSIISDLGTYTYGTINSETSLIQNSVGDAVFSFTNQDQTGGALKAAMNMYFIRFLTESLTATPWSVRSGHIPVFAPSTEGDPKDILGSVPGANTGKRNNFTVTGIVTGLFKYIELAVYINTNNVISAYVVSRTPLTTDNISLSHIGTETTTTTLDAGELLFQEAAYNTARNISIEDNRLVLSNLTMSSVLDFTDIANTFTHSVKKKAIQGVGNPMTTYVAGEYQEPENVYSYAGYMDNETYRFAARFKLKNGYVTDAFWIDDIKMSTGNTNTGNPFSDNRRISGLTNYDLTESGMTGDALVTYIEFNADLSKTVNGVQSRDLVSEILISRVEMSAVNREVLATGIGVMGCYVQDKDYDIAGGIGTSYVTAINYGTQTEEAEDITQTSLLGEFPLSTALTAEHTFSDFRVGYAGTGLYTANATTSLRRKYTSFYSIDMLYGQTSISLLPGDLLLNHGSQDTTYYEVASTYESNLYHVKNGETGTITPIELTINDAVSFAQGGVATVGGLTYTKGFILAQKRYDLGGSIAYDRILWQNTASLVINTDDDMYGTSPAGNADAGTYYIQYFRKIGTTSLDKFGPVTASSYVPTGSSIKIDSATPTLLSFDAFGGDVYTQRCFLKNRIITEDVTGDVNSRGFGAGLSFYSQNYINFQLRTSITYPATLTEGQWLTSATSDVLTYSGFNITDTQFGATAFDPLVERYGDLPTRIAYSELKPQGSSKDEYRTFLPLNFKDLNMSDGPIVHHTSLNGELVTWQPRRVMRQFFNTRSTFQGGDGSEVIIGDGGVMSRDGQTLSLFGSNHKWSFIKGKGKRGNDLIYWVNTEYKNVMRYAGDGPLNLVDLRGMRSFFGTNLRFIQDYDTPANGAGICGVWNDEKGCAIWSFNSKKQGIAEWDNFEVYNEVDVVAYDGEFYQSLTVNNTNNNPSTSDEWEIIKRSNPDYYNQYTIVFSEDRNKFLTFYSFVAKIFLQWKETYFSPRPETNTGKLYLHDAGDYSTWYDELIIEDAYIEMIYNRDETLPKIYNALLANSEVVPVRVESSTKDHNTFMIDTDFEEEFNMFTSGIKNNLNDAGENDDDTSQLWGNYIKAKLIMSSGVFQKIINFVIKYTTINRFYKK